MDLFSGKCLYEDVEYEKLITYICRILIDAFVRRYHVAVMTT